MQRPVWLLSMDSEQFNAPPTTTASLAAYFRSYGASAAATDIELVHFQRADDIAPWLVDERTLLADAVARDIPVLGLCLGGQLLAKAYGASGARAWIGFVPGDDHERIFLTLSDDDRSVGRATGACVRPRRTTSRGSSFSLLSDSSLWRSPIRDSRPMAQPR